MNERKHSYIPYYFKCPFCKHHDSSRKYIVCEGFKNKTRLSIHFDVLEEMKAYERTYCERFSENCEIYKLIMKVKYEGDISD